MKALTGLAYVSSATAAFSEQSLEQLLLDARAFNAGVGVTGVLLHHDGSFFQYIEGPTDGVAQVYDRIRLSQRHHGLFELFRGDIARCHFPEWLMGFAETPQSQILRLSQATWKIVAPGVPDTVDESEGLALLVGHWQLVAPKG